MERTLSEHCNKASSSGALGEYVAARAVVLSPLLDHYAQLYHRKKRWKQHIETERSIDVFINDINALMQREGKTRTVLAWGAWGAVAGRPGMVGNRGKAPCLQSRAKVASLTPGAERASHADRRFLPRVSARLRAEELGADSSADRGADVGRMLAADKLLLRSTVKQKAIELREKELNLFNSNFSFCCSFTFTFIR